MLIVSKYQLDDADIFGWFAPCDKLGRIVIESIWCICTQLIICISVQNKTNIEISIIIYSFTNTHHHKVNRLLNESNILCTSPPWSGEFPTIPAGWRQTPALLSIVAKRPCPYQTNNGPGRLTPDLIKSYCLYGV